MIIKNSNLKILFTFLREKILEFHIKKRIGFDYDRILVGGCRLLNKPIKYIISSDPSTTLLIR